MSRVKFAFPLLTGLVVSALVGCVPMQESAPVETASTSPQPSSQPILSGAQAPEVPSIEAKPGTTGGAEPDVVTTIAATSDVQLTSSGKKGDMLSWKIEGDETEIRVWIDSESVAVDGRFRYSLIFADKVEAYAEYKSGWSEATLYKTNKGDKVERSVSYANFDGSAGTMEFLLDRNFLPKITEETTFAIKVENQFPGEERVVAEATNLKFNTVK